MKSSGHETSLIIPQKNSTSFLFHILKGFYDQSILAEDKGGKTIGTNRDSPCSYLETTCNLYMYNRNGWLAERKAGP